MLILLATGERTFGPQISSPTLTNPFDLAPADFNGDNQLDLVVVNHEFIVGAVSILLGDGTGHFGAPTRFNVGGDPVAVATGDFNGDGSVDLVTANDRTDDGSVLLGNGMGSFGPLLPFQSAANNLVTS